MPSFGSPSFTNAKSTEANPFTTNTKPTTAPANPFKINSTTTQDKKMIDEEFKDTNSSETNGAASEADVCSKSEEKSFGLLKCSPMKNSSPNEEVSNQYVEQITELNLSVFGWIKQHIDEDPLIDLTPVFSDYTKYMRDIDEKYGKKKQGGSGEKIGNDDSNKADVFVSKVTDGVKDNEVKSESASATPVLEKKEETKPIGNHIAINIIDVYTIILYFIIYITLQSLLQQSRLGVLASPKLESIAFFYVLMVVIDFIIMNFMVLHY